MSLLNVTVQQWKEGVSVLEEEVYPIQMQPGDTTTISFSLPTEVFIDGIKRMDFYPDEIKINIDLNKEENE